MSDDPSEKVAFTDVTSVDTSTPTHQTGSPSRTPNDPLELSRNPAGSALGWLLVGGTLVAGTVVNGIGSGAPTGGTVTVVGPPPPDVGGWTGVIGEGIPRVPRPTAEGSESSRLIMPAPQTGARSGWATPPELTPIGPQANEGSR